MPHVIEAVKQRHPHLFGIGREDEAIFETLRQFVPKVERAMLDLIYATMRDYEARLFRLTVVAMDCGSEIVDKPVKDPKKGQPETTKETISWESTDKDLRVKYLQDIADEGIAFVKNGKSPKEAATMVIAMMRARRLVTRSAGAQAAYAAWVGTSEWLTKNITESFGVRELSEITEEMLAQRLNRHVECMVAANPAVLSFDENGKLRARSRSIPEHAINIFRRRP